MPGGQSGGSAMVRQSGSHADGMELLTRDPGGGGPESQYEKVMVLPASADEDPGRHAWADARFAADILAEHALFFALLMPPEVAAKERAQALEFQTQFQTLFDEI